MASVDDLLAELAALRLQTRPTTMPELLEHCHREFVHKLNVERDPSLRIGGSTTAVTNKLRQARLEPGGEFVDLRKSTFARAKNTSSSNCLKRNNGAMTTLIRSEERPATPEHTFQRDRSTALPPKQRGTFCGEGREATHRTA